MREIENNQMKPKIGNKNIFQLLHIDITKHTVLNNSIYNVQRDKKNTMKKLGKELKIIKRIKKCKLN